MHMHPVGVVGVLMCLNQCSGGFVKTHVELLQLIAVQVASELLPQLLEAIAAPTSTDHTEDDADEEVAKLRAWLTEEYSLDGNNDSNCLWPDGLMDWWTDGLMDWWTD